MLLRTPELLGFLAVCMSSPHLLSAGDAGAHYFRMMIMAALPLWPDIRACDVTLSFTMCSFYSELELLVSAGSGGPECCPVPEPFRKCNQIFLTGLSNAKVEYSSLSNHFCRTG